MDIFSLKVEKEYFHISSNLDKNNTSLIYGEVYCKDLGEIITELELNDRLLILVVVVEKLFYIWLLLRNECRRNRN